MHARFVSLPSYPPLASWGTTVTSNDIKSRQSVVVVVHFPEGLEPSSFDPAQAVVAADSFLVENLSSTKDLSQASKLESVPPRFAVLSHVDGHSSLRDVLSLAETTHKQHCRNFRKSSGCLKACHGEAGIHSVGQMKPRAEAVQDLKADGFLASSARRSLDFLGFSKKGPLRDEAGSVPEAAPPPAMERVPSDYFQVDLDDDFDGHSELTGPDNSSGIDLPESRHSRGADVILQVAGTRGYSFGVVSLLGLYVVRASAVANCPPPLAYHHVSFPGSFPTRTR
jgi:hypothetical protein